MASARQPAKPRSNQPRAETGGDSGTRELLLAVGLELAKTNGLKSVSVRAVAASAAVNLGSFVYHFGTRDAFVYELVDRWYAPLMAGLQLSATSPQPLRGALRELAQWVAANGRFLALLVRDAAAGEAGVRDFLTTMDQRHIALLLRLISEEQEAGHLEKGDPALQLMFLVGSVAMPILMLQGLQGLGPQGIMLRLTELAIDESAIESRLSWALRGLATKREDDDE